jgi:hypothetical protein
MVGVAGFEPTTPSPPDLRFCILLVFSGMIFPLIPLILPVARLIMFAQAFPCWICGSVPGAPQR